MMVAILYFIGLIICSIVAGNAFNIFVGWFVMGGGFLLASMLAYLHGVFKI